MLEELFYNEWESRDAEIFQNTYTKNGKFNFIPTVISTSVAERQKQYNQVIKPCPAFNLFPSRSFSFETPKTDLNWTVLTWSFISSILLALTQTNAESGSKTTFC